MHLERGSFGERPLPDHSAFDGACRSRIKRAGAVFNRDRRWRRDSGFLAAAGDHQKKHRPEEPFATLHWHSSESIIERRSVASEGDSPWPPRRQAKAI